MAAHPTNTISLDRIVQRAKEIATFNTRTYSEVAHDPAALPEAAIVVATVAVAAGLGGVIDGANGLLGGIILSLLGWVVTAAIVYFVGTRITGTPTTTGSVESILRTLGYASGPGIFMILGFLWGIGWIFVGLVNLWTLVTTILAIRASLNLSLGRSALTGILALVAASIIRGMLAWIFGTNPSPPFSVNPPGPGSRPVPPHLISSRTVGHRCSDARRFLCRYSPMSERRRDRLRERTSPTIAFGAAHVRDSIHLGRRYPTPFARRVCPARHRQLCVRSQPRAPHAGP